MTLDLGELQLVLSANTKGLDTATAAIKKVGISMDLSAKKIDQSIRRMESSFSKIASASRNSATVQAASGSKIEASLLRQMRATNSAREQFLNLRASIKRSGGDPGLIANITRSFNALEKRMQSGAMSADAFAKAQDRYRAALGRARRKLSDFNKTQKQVQATTQRTHKTFSRFTSKFDEFGRAVRVIEGPLGGTAARLQTLGAALKSVNLITLAAVGAIAGLAFGMIKLIPVLTRLSMDLFAINNALKFATGNAFLAAKSFSFIRKIAKDLGLSMLPLAKDFKLVAAAAKGTVLEGKPLRDLFLGVSQAAVTLGLDTFEVSGIFRAFMQMISKGTVQSEELKGQLGERLPGAFRLAADAMGTTTSGLQKMLEQGQVVTDVFLPKFARLMIEEFAKPAEEAAKGLQAQIGRLSTSFFELGESILAVTGIDWTASRIVQGAGNFVDLITEGVYQAGLLTGILNKSDLPKQFIGPQQADEFEGINPSRIQAEIDKAANKIVAVKDAYAQSVVKVKRDFIQTIAEAERDFNATAANDLFMRDLTRPAKLASSRFASTLTMPKAKRDFTSTVTAAETAHEQQSLNKALAAGVDPMQKLILEQQRYGALLKKYPEHADLITAAQDKVNAKLDESRIKSEVLTFKIQAQLDKNKKTLLETNPVLVEVGKGFDNLAGGIVSAMTTAGSAMEGFQSIARNVVNSILESFVQLSIINPIKNALFGGGFSTLGSIFGGGGGGQAAADLAGGSALFTPFVKGGAFSNGVRMMAKGDILDSPTLFNTSSGLAMGGEAGTEGVLPLKRNSTGDLGVNASGLGGITVVQNIRIETGVSQTIRAEMMSLLPNFRKEAEAGIVAARQRDPGIFSSE